MTFSAFTSWKSVDTIVWVFTSILSAVWTIWSYAWLFSAFADYFSNCRFIFCRAVLFYFHSDEHEYLPTCLPSLPESVSPHAEAIRTPILSLAENLVVSDRFDFRDSTRNKKWWPAAITITHAFCRYLCGKYSPAICWLFCIYTANGAISQHQLAAAAAPGWCELNGDMKNFDLFPLSVCTSLFRCSLICSRHCRHVALSSIFFSILLSWRGRFVSWKRRF
jgi:hypothetical protein